MKQLALMVHAFQSRGGVMALPTAQISLMNQTVFVVSEKFAFLWLCFICMWELLPLDCFNGRFLNIYH
jgi:hypothetical protein